MSHCKLVLAHQYEGILEASSGRKMNNVEAKPNINPYNIKYNSLQYNKAYVRLCFAYATPLIQTLQICGIFKILKDKG